MQSKQTPAKAHHTNALHGKSSETEEESHVRHLLGVQACIRPVQVSAEVDNDNHKGDHLEDATNAREDCGCLQISYPYASNHDGYKYSNKNVIVHVYAHCQQHLCMKNRNITGQNTKRRKIWDECIQGEYQLKKIVVLGGKRNQQDSNTSSSKVLPVIFSRITQTVVKYHGCIMVVSKRHHAQIHCKDITLLRAHHSSTDT